MAREESDREDLLREATALVVRAELDVPGLDEAVVVGFRSSGCGGIYIGAEPVYQFNTAGELRRAFLKGRMLKAEGGRLAELERTRTAHETVLLRRDLDTAESAALLAELRATLGRLAEALSLGRFRLVGVRPEGSDPLPRIVEFLAAVRNCDAIARTPHAK